MSDIFNHSLDAIGFDPYDDCSYCNEDAYLFDCKMKIYKQTDKAYAVEVLSPISQDIICLEWVSKKMSRIDETAVYINKIKEFCTRYEKRHWLDLHGSIKDRIVFIFKEIINKKIKYLNFEVMDKGKPILWDEKYNTNDKIYYIGNHNNIPVCSFYFDDFIKKVFIYEKIIIKDAAGYLCQVCLDRVEKSLFMIENGLGSKDMIDDTIYVN